MSAAESLDAYIDQQTGPDGVDREHWVITDASGAEWALRKLAKLRGQMGQNSEIAREEHRMIDEWRRTRNEILETEAGTFEGLLTTWHAGLLVDDPERKTVSLPNGTLKARKQPDRWEFTDDFTVWAQTHRPELTRTRVEVDKAAAKKTLTAVTDECVVDVSSGEKVPGVAFAVGEVKFSVDARGALNG